MAEQTGSPFRALTRIHLVDATGHRSYTVSVDVVTPDTAAGNQATWEGAPGASLTLTLKWDSTGAPSFGAADTASVNIRLPGDNTNIGSTWSPAITGDSGSATQTFKFNDNPLGAGTVNREGMVEVFLQVSRAAAVAWGPVDSRGGGTPPATSTNTWARGYWRARVTLSSFDLSIASLGGAAATKLRGMDSTFNRAILDAIWYRSVGVTMKHRQSAADVRSEVGANGTAVTRDYTWDQAASGTTAKGRVNKDYAAALTATDMRLVLPNNVFGGTTSDLEYQTAASGHPAGWTVVDGSTLDAVAFINADPRVTFSQLLQINENTFHTTPDTGNVANGQRLSADLGFIAARAVNADGAGLNGLAWTEKLWDDGNLTGSESSPTHSRATTSQTQGTADGWSDAFLTWNDSLPSGKWDQKELITTTDMVGLEVTNTRTLTLLAADPRIRVAIGAGDTANPAKHWSPGQALTVGMAAEKSGVKTAFDASTIFCSIVRFNPTTGTTEFLDSDNTTWSTGDTFYQHAMTSSAGDAKVALFTLTAAQTVGWNYEDVFLIGYLSIASVPYEGVGLMVVVGKNNTHDGGPVSGKSLATGIPFRD